MNFETCCEILKLTKDDLGIDPSSIDQCTADKLEKDVIFFIKHSFRKQALKVHPDKGGKEEDFKALLVAYETALCIIKKAIERKKSTSSFLHKVYIPVETTSNINEMSFEELLKYISLRDPDFLKNFWDSCQTEIDEFVKKTQIIHLRLEEECNKEEIKIFQEAFETYLKNSGHHYKEYQDCEYSNYLKKFDEKKADIKNAIMEQYKPAITKANNLINIGLTLFFLVLPLILSLVQWNKKRKLIQKRDRECTEVDQKAAQSKLEWESTPENYKSKEKWEQEVQYKTLLLFKKNTKCTFEGLAAEKSVRTLKEKLLSRQLANHRLSNEVKGMNRDVKSGEDFIYYSLFRECKAMDHFLHQPEAKLEKRFSLSK